MKQVFRVIVLMAALAVGLMSCGEKARRELIGKCGDTKYYIPRYVIISDVEVLDSSDTFWLIRLKESEAITQSSDPLAYATQAGKYGDGVKEVAKSCMPISVPLGVTRIAVVDAAGADVSAHFELRFNTIKDIIAAGGGLPNYVTYELSMNTLT